MKEKPDDVTLSSGTIAKPSRDVLLTPFLTCNGWRHERGVWLHPLETEAPLLGFTADHAVNVCRMNAYIKLLESVGWNIEGAGVRGDAGKYYVTTDKLRSPRGFGVSVGLTGRRILRAPFDAFLLQHEYEGFAPPEHGELNACVRGNEIFVWCPLCDTWHYHGAGGVVLPNGTRGHRLAHCNRGKRRMRGYHFTIVCEVPR